MPSTKPAISPLLHIEKLRALLRQEYEFDKAEFQRQTQAQGIRRKAKRGLCWYPCVAKRSYYNSINQLVIEITRDATDQPEHSFEFGKPLSFFQVSANGDVNYYRFQGTVSYAGEDCMVAVIPNSNAISELLSSHDLGVELGFDEVSYTTMFQALDNVSRAKGNRLAELRDLLLGQAKANFRQLQPVGFPWLNTTQEAAVNKVLCARDVMIVHGPPGTGKTTTLVEAIYETLHREPQVLVCAQSNMAVDWISEQLVDRGVNVLRIGNPSRVNDKMLSYTYERRFESHPSYSELWSMRKEVRTLNARRRKGSYDERESTRNRISRLRDRIGSLEIQIKNDLFGQANVIASTLVSSAHHLLNGYSFNTLFIDEAAQALEPACWIAIGKVQRVILAGDHCQLPPTVKCFEAQKGGLAYTLMEHIVDHKPEAVALLKIQYRMNEDIMKFSSHWFYHDQLQADPSVRNRSILDLDSPFSWIDTSEMDFKEEFISETAVRINKDEANLLLDSLTAYINKIGGERILQENIDIGIISPYKAQVYYLRSLLKKSAELRTYRHLITISTVDGFQGQERDVIFISLVRANDEGQIGFLRDLRRMNVAITRARMKLVVLGDAVTLSHHPFYRQLQESIKKGETS